MIKDVVIHNGLLRIATGAFVPMVRHSENGRDGARLARFATRGEKCLRTRRSLHRRSAKQDRYWGIC
jgi:hypothetical protein